MTTAWDKTHSSNTASNNLFDALWWRQKRRQRLGILFLYILAFNSNELTWFSGYTTHTICHVQVGCVQSWRPTNLQIIFITLTEIECFFITVIYFSNIYSIFFRNWFFLTRALLTLCIIPAGGAAGTKPAFRRYAVMRLRGGDRLVAPTSKRRILVGCI